MTGIITKGIGGFYYVKCDDGTLFSCRARGKFRKEGQTPTVGDKVEIEVTDKEKHEGYVLSIYSRKNCFFRPPVANIDMLLVTFAICSPEPALELIDKLTVSAIAQAVSCAICINKIELDYEKAKQLADEYKKAGFPVVLCSAKTGEGISDLKALLQDKVTALAGSSGVGKSSLLNAMGEQFSLKTGAVSDKIQRGKHTTRHTELFPLSFGGFVFDTPGFGSFEIEKMKAQDLSFLFPEIQKRADGCRFPGCSHITEPDCAVKEALEKGEIGQNRYNSYCALYDTLKNIKDWQLTDK